MRFGKQFFQDGMSVLCCCFSVFDVDLSTAWFVAAKTFNFRASANTTQRLFEMAVRGNLVLLGAKKIPPDMEFLCDIYTSADF